MLKYTWEAEIMGERQENDDNRPSFEMFSSTNVEGVTILKTFSDQVPTSQVNFSKTTAIYCGISFLSAGITIPKIRGNGKTATEDIQFFSQ